MNNEALLRSKVWEILNTIQANQLYVHSSVMKFKINTEGMDKENVQYIVVADHAAGTKKMNTGRLFTTCGASTRNSHNYNS